MNLEQILPRPRLFIVLLVLWLLLNNSISVGHIVLGAILAWFITRLTRVFWPEEREVKHHFRSFTFFCMVLWDILKANFVLAKMILLSSRRLHPGFVTVPLDLADEFAITTLANVISITPGTVSANLSEDERSLLVHAIHLKSEEELVAQIKNRYERAIKEIFEC